MRDDDPTKVERSQEGESAKPFTGDPATVHTPTIRRVAIDDTASLSSAERYAERGLLGVGGMGEVHQLLDRRLGRVVARKRMTDDQSGERFLREVRIQAQLEHPAIVPVYDLERKDGQPTFTMKRIQGRTLDAVLRPTGRGDERFGPRRILDALAQVALAVDYAHSRGVVHRDLKPSNIMLGEWGEVYVLDWGVARVSHHDRDERLRVDASRHPPGEQTDVVGTPGYMAPEVVRGDDEGSPTSDVYALGCILFFVATGAPLFVGTADERLDAALTGGAVERRVSELGAELAPELLAICEKATAPAAERYESARAFHDALQRYLDGDRDVVLRRDMADRFTERAEDALERIAASGEREDRRDALRCLASALALSPEHPAALRGLVRLLTEPPRKIPIEVRRQLARTDAARSASVTKPASWSALLVIAAVALFAWMGVKSWTTVGLLFVTTAIAFATVRRDGRLAAARARAPEPPVDEGRGDLLPVLASCVAIAFVTRFTGPWLIAPVIAVAMTVLRVLRDERQAWLVGAMAGGSVLVPWALELAGLLPPSTAFVDGTMVFRPPAVWLPRLPTELLLALGVVASVPISVAVGLAFRRTLTQAELELELQAWQLRQMLPDDALVGPTSSPAPAGKKVPEAG